MFQTIINNKYEAEEEAEKEKAPRGLSIFSKVLELQSGGQRLDMGTVGAGQEEGARHACGASAPPLPEMQRCSWESHLWGSLRARRADWQSGVLLQGPPSCQCS